LTSTGNFHYLFILLCNRKGFPDQVKAKSKGKNLAKLLKRRVCREPLSVDSILVKSHSPWLVTNFRQNLRSGFALIVLPE